MKKTAIIVTIVLIVVCGGGGYALMQMRNAKAEAEKAKVTDIITVNRGNLIVQVVENGIVDAVKSVEVKSRVSGRLANLFVEEGDSVKQGQLVAVIDQRETKLQVDQNAAQVRGAQAGLSRTGVDIQQRKITAQAALSQAEIRVKQLEQELKIQPTLTSSAIKAAETAFNTAVQIRAQLSAATHPNERTALESQVREAQANVDNATQEESRRRELLDKGYVAVRDYQSSQLQLELAKTRLKSAQDQLSRLNDKQVNELHQADERVKQTEADLQRAKANSIQDITKRQEYENALAGLKQAKAGLLDVQSLEATRRQGAAQVDQLKSALGESQRQFGETEIKAPMTGVVARRAVELGEQVSSISGFSNGTSIFTIEDRNSLRVKLEINEIDIAKIKVGMPATVQVDAFPDAKFNGIVKKIAPSATTAATGQSADAVVKYKVEVYLDKPDDRLRSGMSAKVTIVPTKKDNVLIVPVEYVGKDEKGSFVVLAPAKKGAKGEVARVTLGAASGASVEILSGIAQGVKLTKPEYKGPPRKGMMQAGGPDE